MSIKSNLKTIVPARERFKVEITLLSHGYYAPEIFPDGKITIYPWDYMVDDWVIREGKRLTGRKIMWALAAKLANLKGFPVENLAVGDQSTILLVARAIRCNNIVRYAPQCSFCGAVNAEDEIKVPNDLAKKGEKTSDFPGHIDITLPVTKDVVRIRPLFVRDEMFIDDYVSKSPAERDGPELSAKILRTLLPIISVGGGEPDNIRQAAEWFSALPPVDTSFLDRQVVDINPELSSVIWHQCDSCSKKFPVPLPLDEPEFFR